MNLALTQREQDGIRATSMALLRPADYGDTESWQRAANSAARELLGADCASFMLPGETGLQLYSEEWGREIPNAYPERVAELDRTHGFWNRQVAAGAWSRRAIFSPAMYRSSYFQDFVVPARAFDAIGITLELDSPGRFAGLLFHHSSRRGPRFGRRAVSILHLLRPPFEAGVRMYCSMGPTCRTMASVVDGQSTALILLDRRGRVVHANPAASDLLGLEGGERMAAAAMAAARDLRSMRAGTLREGSVGSRSIRLGELDVAVHPAPADVELARLHVDVVVTLRPKGHRSARTGQAPDLTAQETRVAEMLRERRTNREIAGALGISPHTARHHTENVLAKLGVRSRRDVMV
jgi:DNA-binding CsgD family transcriptional regulator/PAS domain-containing protein